MTADAKLLVVSPHCDDAAFACGGLLVEHRGAIVTTVFAGGPGRWSDITTWDAAAGFEPRDGVMAVRRREDRSALDVVGASPVWLDFQDAQYGPSPEAADISDALASVIERTRPRVVALPLGLFHSDHVLARDSTLAARRRFPSIRWVAYEDAIYRRIPGLVADALTTLRGRAVALSPAPSAAQGGEVKRRAVACYASQLRALSGPGYPGYEDAFAPERCWTLAA